MDESENYSMELLEEEISVFFKNNKWDSNSNAVDLLKILKPSCFYFSKILDLNVIQRIINFSKEFIAGKNSEFNVFKTELKSYDFSVTCGLSWLESDFGYRCLTCCRSPYIAWCAPCFNNGNHSGHDFVKFKCTAGGSCDCGNADAMPESGYCCHHGPSVLAKQRQPPEDLIRRLKQLIPIYLKCFLISSWSLIQNYNSDELLDDDVNHGIDGIVSMVMPFINDLLICGGMVKEIIAKIMIDKEFYNDFIQDMKDADLYELYINEMLTDSDLIFCEESGSQLLQHETMLDVFMFLCVKFRFHNNVISFLIGLLTNDSYKKLFIESFINNYPRIAYFTLQQVELQRYNQDDLMSTILRISDMSVQFIIFEGIALKMVQEKNLHYVILFGIRYMLHTSLLEILGSEYYVLDSESSIIQKNMSLSFLSDWVKLLSHKSVVDFFISDRNLMKEWTKLLSWMQFMDFFMQKEGDHVRDNLMTCYGAMNLEIIFSIKPMWNVWYNYLAKDNKENVLKLVGHFIGTLARYLGDVRFFDEVSRYYQSRRPLSFHLPLIRNTTCFLSLALFRHDVTLATLLNGFDTSDVILWFKEVANVLLGCQEILVGYWLRNGDSPKTSRHFYGYDIYCYGFLDLDILGAQICASVMPSSEVIYILTDPTQLLRGIKFAIQYKVDGESTSTNDNATDIEKQSMALEAWFTTLCWLLDLRNEMDSNDDAKLRKEVCSKLCIEPMRHSNLKDRLPDRSSLHQSIDIDVILNEVANFTGPTFDEYSGVLLSGLYTFKSELWDSDYDPVFQSCRSETKQDILKALEKYRDYYRQKENIAQHNSLWPPYRIPPHLHRELLSLENILHCRDVAYILFCCLQMFVNGDRLVNEDTLAIIVHILHRSQLTEEALDGQGGDNGSYNTRYPNNPYKVNNMNNNIRHNVDLYSGAQNKKISVIVQWDSILSLLLKIHSKLHANRLRMGGKPLLLMKTQKLFRKYPATKEFSPNLHHGLNLNSRDFKEKYSFTMSLDFYMKYPLVYHYSEDNLKIAQDTGLGINWGDGVDFIGHLLDIISSRNDDNSKYLLELAGNICLIEADEVNSDCDSINSKDDLSGSQSDVGDVRVLDSFHLKKQKANDRRKKLMSNMLLKQKTFASTYQHQISDSAAKDESGECRECVICQRVTASKTERTVFLGMVCSANLPMFMRHRHIVNKSPISMTQDCDNLDKLSKTSSIPPTGIIIQTCGHVVHQECFDKYKRHKESTMDTEEWITCPMCRREVHYLLPINTEDILVTSEDSFYSNFESRLLKSFVTPPCDIQNNFIGTSYVSKNIGNIDIEHQACSLLRSQLELELIVCLSAPDQYSTVNKRCHWPQFITYLRTLNANITTLIRQSDRLLGTSMYDKIKKDDDENGSSQRRPFLLEVPSDVLLNFIPYVWPYEDQVRYILDACIVMAYIKGMVMVASKLDRSQYDHWSTERPYADEIEKQFIQISMRLKTLGYIPSLVDPTKDLRPQYILTNNTMINELVKCLLPVLRLAAVLKLRHLKAKDIPKNFPGINTIDNETLNCMEHFIQLCEYLNLTKSKYSPHECSTLLESLISNCLKSILYGTFIETVNVYVNEEFIDVLMKEQKELREPILNVLNIGNELCLPRLIPLPKSYEDLFIAHQTKKCVTSKLDHDRQRNGLCLICGELLCLLCPSIPMAIFKHSVACCLGLGVIIDVNSSIVFVLVNDEVAQWGSVYLDYYGEEDLELKRGRPLFVNGPRLKLLEQQWMTLSFKHVLKMWTRI